MLLLRSWLASLIISTSENCSPASAVLATDGAGWKGAISRGDVILEQSILQQGRNRTCPIQIPLRLQPPPSRVSPSATYFRNSSEVTRSNVKKAAGRAPLFQFRRTPRFW